MRSTVASVLALIMMVAATGVAAADGQPRLKYRGKGLACTCAGGMSEDDIRKGLAARFPHLQDAPLDNLDGRPPIRDEQRRAVDEAQPR
ncbi:MAG TPA: hypothetical protein PKC12_00810 [Thiobacillaceae bacterium]|nr:hypothetical protein [Thiobacillaceae bacterium]